MRQNVLVFTDLDGSLLDPVSYSFSAAVPALEVLRAQRIPLVLCSSKTRAEMMLYRQRLGNGHPFIVENGGAVYVPSGYFATPIASDHALPGFERITLGTPHAEVRRQFVALRAQTGARVRGFTDMDVAEIATLTGLDAEQAALARQREFDEPFVFDGPVDAGFLQTIKSVGLNWTEGRLHHILGQHDKGRAVRLLKTLYELEHGAMTTLGLGDGPNDLPMLRAVDHAVLVRHPGDWNDAVLDFLCHGHD